MIRKTFLLWRCTLQVRCIRKLGMVDSYNHLWSPEKILMKRYYSDEPIFKVRKTIDWDESFDQSPNSQPQTSSPAVQTVQRDEIEEMVDLDSTQPKTLAQATTVNRLRIKKLHEMLQQFDEQMQHENFFKKLSEKWNLKMEFRKARSVRPQDDVMYTKELLTSLDRSAAQLYFDCANRYPYLKLCTALCLPDYFSTWYKLTLIHTWMLLVRLQSALEAGAFIRFRNSLIEIMFGDVDKRLRLLSEELHEMLYHKNDKRRMTGLYIQTFFEYDEGFLSNDTTLAGALWRNLYMQRSVDPIHLNRAVYYVRGTMAYLDNLSLEEILLQGIKEWRTARPDNKLSSENAFEVAKNVASSLVKQKHKHV